MNNTLKDYLFILIALIFLKAGLFVWGVYQFDFEKYPDETVFTIWNHWDALHYQKIAEHGYGKAYEEDDNRFMIFFPPMFPFATSVTEYLTGFSYSTSSFIVSNVFSVFVSFILFSLVKFEFKSREKAYFATLLLNIFPTAYFLFAPYSESIFLFFTLLFFYFLRVRESLLLASLSLAGSMLSRSVGFVLIPVFLFYILTNKKFRFYQILYFLIPAIAFCFQNIIGYLYHDDFMFLYTYRPDYTIKFGSFPFQESFDTFISLWRNPYLLIDKDFSMIRTWSSIFLIGGCIISVYGLKKIPEVYSLFSLIYLLFLSSCTHLIAMPRYVLCCFPLFLILSLVNKRLLFAMIILSSFSLMLYFSSMYVNGLWAF